MKTDSYKTRTKSLSQSAMKKPTATKLTLDCFLGHKCIETTAQEAAKEDFKLTTDT